MPPYVIAHDATLRAIAEREPALARGAQPREGDGPPKVDKYGDEILAVLERGGGGAAGTPPTARDPDTNRGRRRAGGLGCLGAGLGDRAGESVPAEPA